MSFHSTRIENHAQAQQVSYDTQLDADLATGIRGGNKARLVARCYVACMQYEGMLSNPDYEAFRAAHIGKTFAKLHELFDQVLKVLKDRLTCLGLTHRPMREALPDGRWFGLQIPGEPGSGGSFPAGRQTPVRY